MASTVVIPIAITSASPRSFRINRMPSHRRMFRASAPNTSAGVPRTKDLLWARARAVAQHDVVDELIALDGLRRPDVDRDVDVQLRQRAGRLRGVREDAECRRAAAGRRSCAGHEEISPLDA